MLSLSPPNAVMSLQARYVRLRCHWAVTTASSARMIVVSQSTTAAHAVTLQTLASVLQTMHLRLGRMAYNHQSAIGGLV